MIFPSFFTSIKIFQIWYPRGQIVTSNFCFSTPFLFFNFELFNLHFWIPWLFLVLKTYTFMQFWWLLTELWVIENRWPRAWPQISRGHIFWPVGQIHLKISEMDSGPTITLCTNFHQNLRDEGVKHWLISQRMPLMRHLTYHCFYYCLSLYGTLAMVANSAVLF